MENIDFQYRVAIIGDAGVGKSMLLAREIEGNQIN